MAQTGAPKGAQTDFVQMLSEARFMPLVGQKPTFALQKAMAALPPKADIGWRTYARIWLLVL
jgi:hypothetical protein